MTTEDQDVESLQRVLTRLALTEDSKLQPVLHKLLPLVLGKLHGAPPPPPLQKAALDILSHVNKRMHAAKDIQLPVEELITTYVSSTCPLARNLALLYIDQGVERLPREHRFSVMPRLLDGIATRIPQHRTSLLRTAVLALEGLGAAQLGTTGIPMEDANFASQLPFLQSIADRRLFLEYALRTMMYSLPSSLSSSVSAVPSQSQRLGNLGPSAGPPAALAQPGLSLADVAAIEGKSRPDGAALQRRKLGILVFTARAMSIPPEELLLLYIAASNDGNEIVSRLGEELLKRRCAVSGAHPPVDIERENIVKSLWSFYQGAMATEETPAGVSLPQQRQQPRPRPVADDARPPPGAAIQATVLSLLCRSVTAAKIESNRVVSLLSSLFLGHEGSTMPPRLRQVTTDFALWSLKHMNVEDLGAISNDILHVFERVKWLDADAATGATPMDEDPQFQASVPPSRATLPTAKSDELLRCMYHIVGILAQRCPFTLQGRIEIAKRCFKGLANDPPGLRAAAAEAANCLAGAFATHVRGDSHADDEVSAQVSSQHAVHLGASRQREQEGGGAIATQVLTLLEDSILHPQEAVRAASLHWAARVFPFHHVQARYLCILGAGDSSWQLAEAAGKGLSLESFLGEHGHARERKKRGDDQLHLSDTSESRRTTIGERDRVHKSVAKSVISGWYPDLGAMLGYIQQRHPQLGLPAFEGRGLPLPAKSLSAAIGFLEECRREMESQQCKGESDGVVQGYLVLLENALIRQASADLHAASLQAMLSIANAHKSAFNATFATRPSLFQRMLSHVSPHARDAAARMLGMLCSAMPPQDACKLMEGMATPLRLRSAVAQKEANGKTGQKLRYETADGMIAALGYITAQLISGSPSVETGTILDALQVLRDRLESAEFDAELRASAALALGTAAVPLPTSVLESLPDAGAVVATIASQLLSEKNPKVARRAMQALGFVCRGHRHGNVLIPAVDALFSVKAWKDRPAVSAAGEALCFALGGVEVTEDDLLRASFHSLAEWSAARQAAAVTEAEVEEACENGTIAEKNESIKDMEIDKLQPKTTDARVSAQIDVDMDTNAEAGIVGSKADHRETCATATTAAAEDSTQREDLTAKDVTNVLPDTKDPTNPRDDELEVRQLILSTIFDQLLSHTRTEVRYAGATWLVSLLLYCGKSRPEILAILPRAQDALSALLADETEATQEMASRGLAAAYELADVGMREALVDALMGTLSGAPGRKRRAADLSADSKLFDPGTLGTAPGGGALSTYREICQLATDMGQPDLMYKFMQLANADAAANASRGAAFGVATVAKLAGSSLLSSKLDAMVPRLYRSLYDPQPKVRDAMHHIWVALIDDPRDTLRRHFDPVARGLTVDMTSGQWKVREAAAAATADLVQGRRWNELAPHFQSMWLGCFRVMDDVKESVRQAGMVLARTLRGLTLRLTDAELSSPAEGRAAVAASLPVLLEQGLPSRVVEIQALAVETVSKVVGNAGPEVVRRHLRVLVPALLESLSGLEDVRLNYVEQHAARLGVDSGRLEAARVSAAQGSLVGETIDACARALDGAGFAELAPSLAGLIRRGAGLATRAGAGRFVAHVARRLGGDAAPAAPPLIRALEEACFAERSATVRRSYASALATLASIVAPPSRVDRLVASWLETATSDDTDAGRRAVVGVLLRALSRDATAAFNRCAGEISPVAFLMQHEPETSVSEVWTEVWEECSSAGGAGLRLHMRSILDMALAGLASTQWARKRASGVTLATAVKTVGGDAVGPYAVEIANALLKELPGRLWDGKQAILTALGILATVCPRALSNEEGGTNEPNVAVADRIVAAFIEAAEKKKSVYRKEALVQLKLVLLEAWPQNDYMTMVEAPLMSICADFLKAKNDPNKDAASSIKANGGGVGGGDATNLKKTAYSSSSAAAAAATGTVDTSTTSPIIEALDCLGAAWSSSHDATAWLSRALEMLVGVLGAVHKPPEQVAAVHAAERLVDRCGRTTTAEGSAVDAAAAGMDTKPVVDKAMATSGSVLSEAGDVVQGFLLALARLAEESKVSSIREHAGKVLGAGLKQVLPRLRSNAEDECNAWRQRLEGLMQREKVPSVRAVLIDAFSAF